MGRYFVTGGTGFIGGRLVRQLVDAGHQVVALVRDPARAGDLKALGAELCSGDINDKEQMRPGMAGADGVFHLAGWYQVGVRDKRPGERINVDGTRCVLELMRDLAIPKGVYTSSLAVFGDTRGRVVDETYFHAGPWLSEYDRTKWVAHYEVAKPMMEAGLPLVIAQPGTVYGPGDTSALGKVLKDYLLRKLPMVPAKSAYCWGHVDDTARGLILAMERGRAGESYIIAGPSHTVVEALQVAERLTGIPAPRVRVPPGVVKALASVVGAIEGVIPVPGTYSAEYLRVAAGATYLGSSAKARRELEFEARPLAEGLGETLKTELGRLMKADSPSTASPPSLS